MSGHGPASPDGASPPASPPELDPLVELLEPPELLDPPELLLDPLELLDDPPLEVLDPPELLDPLDPPELLELAPASPPLPIEELLPPDATATPRTRGDSASKDLMRVSLPHSCIEVGKGESSPGRVDPAPARSSPDRTPERRAHEIPRVHPP